MCVLRRLFFCEHLLRFDIPFVAGSQRSPTAIHDGPLVDDNGSSLPTCPW